MRENEDKMEELESSLFSQRSSFRSNRGSVSVAFLFPPGRFFEHVIRAFRRLPLVGPHNNTRDFVARGGGSE